MHCGTLNNEAQLTIIAMLAIVFKIAIIKHIPANREGAMTTTTVNSTEFQHRAGKYIEISAKGPVYITKYNHPVRVLIDVDEYERLKANDDTRKALYLHELDDEIKAELRKGYKGPSRPELDHLME